ncbi:MAG: hypothetical protein VW338_04770 [Rhodospirillaceae bacterium]
MADPREDILVRLQAVCAAVEGIAGCYRNDEIPETARPAIMILDADETAADDDPQPRPPAWRRRVTMTPELYVLLGGPPATVGSDLNALRAKVIKAVLTDATLNALTLNGCGIRYEACVTALARGRSMEGELGLSFAFTYDLSPTTL